MKGEGGSSVDLRGLSYNWSGDKLEGIKGG